MASVRISVRLDAQLERRLRAAARAASKNESDVVRQALGLYFAECARDASALQVAQQAGVVGYAKGLPADLSVNKSHLEGLGR